MDRDSELREGFAATQAAMAAASSPPVPFDLDPGGIPLPPRHTTYVQLIAAGGFFASCYVCGSEPFPDRRTLAEAESDAQNHGELRHAYSRQTLIDHDKSTQGEG